MEETSPKPFVFVLMPFSDEFSDTYDLGIEPACKDAGAYCERVDKQIFLENILMRIYNQIAKADIIISEMSGRNPNVFYETGYAHALNKQVILITRNADDIPFDLKHYPHIVYGGKIALLKSELEKRVRWCLENPKESLSTVDYSIELSIGGIPLDQHPVVEYAGRNVYFTIDVHNKTNKILDEDLINLALITPVRIHFSHQVRSTILLPDGRHLTNLEIRDKFFPDSWESIAVGFDTTEDKRDMEILLRLFTELGPRDYTFHIKSGLYGDRKQKK